ELVRRIWISRVARRNVEHAIRAKMNVSAVVSTLKKAEDDHLARRINPRRQSIGDGESRNPRPICQISRPGILATQRVADETLPVAFKVRMKRQSVNGLDVLRIRK